MTTIHTDTDQDYETLYAELENLVIRYMTAHPDCSLATPTRALMDLARAFASEHCAQL